MVGRDLDCAVSSINEAREGSKLSTRNLEVAVVQVAQAMYSTSPRLSCESRAASDNLCHAGQARGAPSGV